MHGIGPARKFKSAIWLVLAMGVSMNACGSGGHKWGEEVRLSDGRIIVVERETITERGGGEWAHNRAGVKPVQYRIRFPAQDGVGQMVEWKSTRQSPKAWPEKPLVLDIEAGRPVVLSSVYIEGGCEVYLKYRYQDGAWVEQALPETFEQRAANLLIRDGIGMPQFVNLQEKIKGNADPNYRRTLRQVGPSRKVCGK
jgi:hypothetical protein